MADPKDRFEVVVTLERKKVANPDQVRKDGDDVEFIDTPVSWMDLDGKPTPDRAKAAKFTFRLFPTMRDVARLEQRIDEVNEGIGNTVDLDVAIGNLWDQLRLRYEAALWPNGRPKAETTEELDKQAVAMQAAFDGDGAHRDRLVLRRMENLRRRNETAAEWTVFIVDPPKGWEDISTKVLDKREYHDAVLAAYSLAKSAAEVAAGK